VLVVSLFALLESMQHVLARIPAEQKHHTVSRVRLTLQECMVEVMDALRAVDPATVRFEDLLLGDTPTRERVVLAFLSILELAKIQALLIFQNVAESGLPEGPIRVRLAVGAALDAAAIAEAGARADAEMDGKLTEGELDGGEL
jgi:chromatin segregation and condensation protein Rec8/ScpA/Scc1 (kleisin family)